MKIKYHFNTIEKIIKDFVGDYKITPDGEIAINSPYVHDTTYDCRISVDKQCFHDWESDESGSIIKLITFIKDVEDEEAEQILLDYAMRDGGVIEVQNEVKKSEIKEIKVIDLPPGVHSFDKNDNSGTLGGKKRAMDFLVKKMVNYSLCKKYDLRWTDISFIDWPGKNRKINLSNRVIIPSYDEGRLVYYQGRDFTNNDLAIRWANPPKEIQPKSIILPFYDTLKKKDPLFISEGCWEAIQYGGTYMIGNAISDRFILKVKSLDPESIYYIPDNDETGKMKLLKNIYYLRRFLDCPIFIIKWWIGEYAKFKDPIDAHIDYNKLLESDIILADQNLELRMKMGEIWSV